ncbi:MAG TPA: sulfatase [Bryobacteraceae bacterium]|nr:sulfatase [Bryobacteraceae bacterium]
MNRRAFLGLASAGAAAGRIAPLPNGPLNFIFILADDLGWADTGPYGADLHETPNLNRLAASGMRFTAAYAAAPVCSPTRASIMTGKHPARLHMTIWHEASQNPPRDRRLIPPVTVGSLPHQEVTIAEALKARGYSTAHVGKWHLGTAGSYPETQGFDVNIGGTFWGAPPTYFYPYRGNKRFGGEYRYVPHLEWGEPGEYLTDRLTAEALKIVDRVQQGPFLLNLWYHTVHTPIEGKPELVARYRDRIRPGMHHRNAAYAAMVHSLDENVGRILRRLNETGLADRTVVVFTSDNGGFIGNFEGQPATSNHPLRSGKGSLYEGGIRVPLLVRWPGVTEAGAVSEEPVTSCDLFRTMLAMAGATGAAADSGLDGLSLVPLLRNPRATLARDALYFHYPHYYDTTSPVSAVRARQWKLLEFHEDHRVELYDLARDPGESRNLAAQLPERAAELRGRLHRWLESVAAQMPEPNPDYPRAR